MGLLHNRTPAGPLLRGRGLPEGPSPLLADGDRDVSRRLLRPGGQVVRRAQGQVQRPPHGRGHPERPDRLDRGRDALLRVHAAARHRPPDDEPHLALGEEVPADAQAVLQRLEPARQARGSLRDVWGEFPGDHIRGPQADRRLARAARDQLQVLPRVLLLDARAAEADIRPAPVLPAAVVAGQPPRRRLLRAALLRPQAGDIPGRCTRPPSRGVGFLPVRSGQQGHEEPPRPDWRARGRQGARRLPGPAYEQPP